MGGVLAKKKDWAAAVAALHEAIRMQPKNAAAHGKLAAILAAQGGPAEGLRTLVAALKEHPDLAEQPPEYLRYDAACFAMNCADGLGDPPPPEAERAGYRKQALDFLTAELAATRKRAGAAPAIVHRRLQHWLTDKDLASVRDPAILQLMPPEERDAWTRLWTDVRILRGQTALKPAPRPSVKPGTKS